MRGTYAHCIIHEMADRLFTQESDISRCQQNFIMILKRSRAVQYNMQAPQRSLQAVGNQRPLKLLCQSQFQHRPLGCCPRANLHHNIFHCCACMGLLKHIRLTNKKGKNKQDASIQHTSSSFDHTSTSVKYTHGASPIASTIILHTLGQHLQTHLSIRRICHTLPT